MFPCYEFIYTVRFVRVRGKFVSNVCACLYLMSGAMPWALIHKKGYKQAGRRFLDSQNTWWTGTQRKRSWKKKRCILNRYNRFNLRKEKLLLLNTDSSLKDWAGSKKMCTSDIKRFHGSSNIWSSSSYNLLHGIISGLLSSALPSKITYSVIIILSKLSYGL